MTRKLVDHATFKLSNGLEVILHESDDVPTLGLIVDIWDPKEEECVDSWTCWYEDLSDEEEE